MFNFLKKKATDTSTEYQTNTSTKNIQDYTDPSIIANYFQNITGITFDKQESILRSKLSIFCKHRSINSFTILLEKIKENQQIKQDLIDHLTTNETFFYREIKQVQELVKLVKESHTTVRILCAPSATGEEPYSIAIALLQAGVLASKFSIHGIDINSQAIQKAKHALYNERNLRNLSAEIRSEYFIQENEQFKLKRSVTSLVSFSAENLFSPDFSNLGKFDFVFSRNMLIYFDKETKQKAKNILEKMRKSTDYKVFFGHADLF